MGNCTDITYLPDALATYTSLTGAVPDEATGLLSITPAQFSNLQSLFFEIGSVSTLHHTFPSATHTNPLNLPDHLRIHAQRPNLPARRTPLPPLSRLSRSF